MDSVKIRGLKGKDARLISPSLGRAIKKIDFNKKDEEQIGIDIVSYLLEEELENLWAWIADLAGLTPVELDNAPVDMPFNILKTVFEQNKDSFFLKLQTS